MTSIDNLAAEIMQGLQEYADLADTAMKKAVRKSATQVKNEISANAPKDTGKYAKSWATKKTGENSHSLEITVHSKNRYQLAHLLEKRISAGETMGFMGFLAAGMAGNNPLLLILSALLIGGLTVAGNGMEINTGLPAATMQILIMLVLLTIMTVGGKRKA